MDQNKTDISVNRSTKKFNNSFINTKDSFNSTNAAQTNNLSSNNTNRN